MISTQFGMRRIDEIKPGDKVYSFDEKTQEVSLKRVLQTYEKESDELVHITVGDSVINATPTHPFYVPTKGWTEACELRAGDVLYTVNGEYVVVEQVQHEIIEEPIRVYNFSVEDNHTYFVCQFNVLVHNICHEGRIIDDFIAGKAPFDSVLDDYEHMYSECVNSNKPWSWPDSIPGQELLTKKQKSQIKQRAIDNGLIPNVKVTKVEGMRYGFADFESAGVVKETVQLPEEMWKMSDAIQFEWLNSQIGDQVPGYTWHHTEVPGKMQLVPTGIHSITTHNGGRSLGMWADAPR